MAILGASVQQASSPWNNASMTTVNHPLAGHNTQFWKCITASLNLIQITILSNYQA